MATGCADEVTVDPVAFPFVQSVDEMTSRPERLAEVRLLLNHILDNMAALG